MRAMTKLLVERDAILEVGHEGREDTITILRVQVGAKRVGEPRVLALAKAE